MMDTKPLRHERVGIRELKESAPELVQRASKGERFIVTRYGKPAAVLVPPEIESELDTPALAAWKKEKAAFDAQQQRLLRRYRGKYVALRRGRVVDADADHDRLSERMWRRFRGEVFFIGRVGAPPPIVEVPGFEIV